MSDSVDAKTRVMTARPESASMPDGIDTLSSLPLKPQERYQFIRSIGFGGMKGVLLVYDKDTGREVAMAIMPDFRERPRNDLERFVREAKLTARLEHPNIVPVHDLGIDSSGSPFFTMKYLHGQSLASLIRKLRKEDPDTVHNYGQLRLLQIFIRICNAMEFAHSQGICHLDLKPENVNIGEFGEVLVLDWGLARAFGPEAQVASPNSSDTPGHAKGTPGYMSPEQLRSVAGEVGPRSDIYALGGILYTMLSLSSPLSKLPVEEVLRRTASGEVPPLSAVAPADRHIPAALEAICQKAMALRSVDRYASVVELREDIFAFQTGYVPKAENASALKHAGLFLSRNMQILLLLMVIFLTMLLATLVYYYAEAVR